MLIQVDIDSTLYDADKLFWEVGDDLGIRWPMESYSWSQPNGITKLDGTLCNRQDLIRIFRKAHSKEYIMKNVPYADSVETINNLVEEYDVEIAYVSDRNEQQNKALQEWLQQEGFLSKGNEHVIATKDKRDWMRKFLPNIVIDDRVRTILMARYELDADVVALRMNWNMNLRGEADGIYVCDDWKEIGRTVEKIITGG